VCSDEFKFLSMGIGDDVAIDDAGFVRSSGDVPLRAAGSQTCEVQACFASDSVAAQLALSHEKVGAADASLYPLHRSALAQAAVGVGPSQSGCRACHLSNNNVALGCIPCGAVAEGLSFPSLEGASAEIFPRSAEVEACGMSLPSASTCWPNSLSEFSGASDDSFARPYCDVVEVSLESGIPGDLQIKVASLAISLAEDDACDNLAGVLACNSQVVEPGGFSLGFYLRRRYA
jgi:hypothetical protein